MADKPTLRDILGPLTPSDYEECVARTREKYGDPPLIGTFTPKKGDIGIDEDGYWRVWDGTKWYGRGLLDSRS
jgi:hypothetical protein